MYLYLLHTKQKYNEIYDVTTLRLGIQVALTGKTEMIIIEAFTGVN